MKVTIRDRRKGLESSFVVTNKHWESYMAGLGQAASAPALSTALSAWAKDLVKAGTKRSQKPVGYSTKDHAFSFATIAGEAHFPVKFAPIAAEITRRLGQLFSASADAYRTIWFEYHVQPENPLNKRRIAGCRFDAEKKTLFVTLADEAGDDLSHSNGC